MCYALDLDGCTYMYHDIIVACNAFERFKRKRPEIEIKLYKCDTESYTMHLLKEYKPEKRESAVVTALKKLKTLFVKARNHK